MAEDIGQQLRELNQQIVQLYGRGQYEEATRRAIQARDLAHNLGEHHPDYAKTLNNLAMMLRSQVYDAGEIIVNRGDVGNEMYFIARGQANHSFCRPSRYSAASRGFQSAQHAGSAPNTNSTAQRRDISDSVYQRPH